MTQDRRINERRPGRQLVQDFDAPFTALNENDFDAIYKDLGGDAAWAKTFGYHQIGFRVQGAIIERLRDTASQSQAVPSELASLKELASKATPGPWQATGRYIGSMNHRSCVGEVRDENGNWSDTARSTGNAAYIAAANPATILKLIEQVESLSHSAATGRAPEGYEVSEASEVVRSFALEDGRCVMGDPDLGALKDGTYWICKAPVYRRSASPAAPLAGKAEPTAIYQTMEGEFGEYWADADKARFDEANAEGISTRIVYTAPLAAAVPAEEASNVQKEIESIADELEDAAAPYGGDFADTVNGCAEALRQIADRVSAVPAIGCGGSGKCGVGDLPCLGCDKCPAAPAEPAPILASALTDERINSIWNESVLTSVDEGKPLNQVVARAIEREVLARDSITIHRDGMANNSHYRERVFNQILELDAKEGLSRFARLPTPTAPVAADAAVTAPSIDKLESELELLVSIITQGGVSEKVARDEIRKWANRHIATHAQAPAGRDAQQWISVDERLPQDNQTVAILYWPYNNHENSQVAGAAEYVDGTFYTHEGDDHHPPSHWAPIPAVSAVPHAAEQTSGGEHAPSN